MGTCLSTWTLLGPLFGTREGEWMEKGRQGECGKCLLMYKVTRSCAFLACHEAQRQLSLSAALGPRRGRRALIVLVLSACVLSSSRGEELSPAVLLATQQLVRAEVDDGRAGADREGCREQQ